MAFNISSSANCITALWMNGWPSGRVREWKKIDCCVLLQLQTRGKKIQPDLHPAAGRFPPFSSHHTSETPDIVFAAHAVMSASPPDLHHAITF